MAAGIAAADGLARLLLISDDKREEGARGAFALQVLVSDRLVLLDGVAVLLTAGAKALIEPVLPLHPSERLGTSASAVGLLFGTATKLARLLKNRACRESASPAS